MQQVEKTIETNKIICCRICGAKEVVKDKNLEKYWTCLECVKKSLGV
jgi:hypothetical protein